MENPTPTCDYCDEFLMQRKGESILTCTNPECDAQFELQEGRLVLIAAPIEERG